MIRFLLDHDRDVQSVLSRVEVRARREKKERAAAYGHSKVVRRLPRDPKAPR